MGATKRHTGVQVEWTRCRFLLSRFAISPVAPAASAACMCSKPIGCTDIFTLSNKGRSIFGEP